MLNQLISLRIQAGSALVWLAAAALTIAAWAGHPVDVPGVASSTQLLVAVWTATGVQHLDLAPAASSSSSSDIPLR